MARAGITQLLPLLGNLSDTQIELVSDVAKQFATAHEFLAFNWQLPSGQALLTQSSVDDLGDIIRLHHAFSREAFSKDKFEYAFERVLRLHGHQADLAPRGNRGYDIKVDGERFSLKTEASNTVRSDRIHISKFMELGGGTWATDPADLVGLRAQYLAHLAGYEHVVTLRRLKETRDHWYSYELVLIPKEVLLLAGQGVLEMMATSRQNPRPGYAYVGVDGWVHQPGVRVKPKELKLSLYFDGGGERKLQIKHLQKDLCTVLATWSFESLAT